MTKARKPAAVHRLRKGARNKANCCHCYMYIVARAPEIAGTPALAIRDARSNRDASSSRNAAAAGTSAAAGTPALAETPAATGMPTAGGTPAAAGTPTAAGIVKGRDALLTTALTRRLEKEGTPKPKDVSKSTQTTPWL